MMTDGKSRLWIGSGGWSDFISSTALSSNTWYHMAITHNSSTNVNRMYINGAYEGATTRDVSDQTTNGTVIGGYRSETGYYHSEAYMEEIRITQAERYTGTSTGAWSNFYSEKSGASSGDAIDYEWATSTSDTAGSDGSYATTFPTITTTAKDRYIDYQYDDNGIIKYWGTTDGQLRPYTTAPNDLTKLHVDEDTGNYLKFIEAKIDHIDWQQNITNELDTDSSSPTYNQLVYIQEIELIGKYKPESFQFSGNENVFIVDARWSNDMLKWVDSNFNSVTEGGVGHNTSIQFVDGKFRTKIWG